MNKVPLTFQLPQVQWLRSDEGWYSVPWTPESRAIAEANRYKLVPGAK